MKLLLQPVQVTALRQPFDRFDPATLHLDGQGGTGEAGPVVHQHGAGPALAAVAALLCSGQVKPLAQQVKQCYAGIFQSDFARRTVDCQANREGHEASVRFM
ncbi:hypothetical protein GALL_540190 [mine drainage metagenome]|uniref:Uncharacterized protein n=1 Tax=mine drainage metagenome TaxID=410659 RepID=A0A1J5PLL8_9ZZZZ